MHIGNMMRDFVCGSVFEQYHSQFNVDVYVNMITVLFDVLCNRIHQFRTRCLVQQDAYDTVSSVFEC